MRNKWNVRISVILAIFILTLIFPKMGHAAPQTMLYLNGNSIPLTEPIIHINNSVMVPVRVVSEELGYKVGWSQKDRTVSIQNSNNEMLLTVDKQEATVNKELITMDVAATIKKGITLVPLRFIGESMGLKVEWNSKTYSVNLLTPIEQTPDVSKDAAVTAIEYNENNLHISLDQNVEPKVMTMVNPDRIVIDIPNTTFASSFTQINDLGPKGQGEIKLDDASLISQIRFSMFSTSPNTTRFVMDMKAKTEYDVVQDGQGLISISLLTSDNGQPEIPPAEPLPTETIPSVIPIPPVPPLEGYAVMLDAGHGGNTGSLSVQKRYEDEFNLALTLKIAELAKQETGFHVVLTRDTDVKLATNLRAPLANSANVDLFISIHGNSAGDRSPVPSGTETYYQREDSKAFAEIMHKYLMLGTQFRDRGVKQANFDVIRRTTMPAVLLEIGFITNPNEEETMYSEDFQWQVAEQIIAGIKAQLGLTS
ncbi:MAG: N-acetylmuramoyl-L-alanine amidase [Candidatus Pristimantibacillus sp.]